MHNLAHADQLYEIALLTGYKQDCSYCGIEFLAKPCHVDVNYNPEDGASVDIIWDKPIFTQYKEDINDEKIHFAVVWQNPHSKVPNVNIFELINVRYFSDRFGCIKTTYHCKRLSHTDISLITRVAAAYRRNFLNGCELSGPLYNFDKLPALTVVPSARNCDNDIIEQLKQEIREDAKKSLQRFDVFTVEQFKKEFLRGYTEILQELGVDHVFKNVPVITKCIINDPAVVVFWSDGTKTVGKCMGDDEFNPEIGLAMAISRKYYEILGFPNPRGAFKKQLKTAEDQSAKTKEKRERKLKLPEAAEA